MAMILLALLCWTCADGSRYVQPPQFTQLMPVMPFGTLQGNPVTFASDPLHCPDAPTHSPATTSACMAQFWDALSAGFVSIPTPACAAVEQAVCP